MKLPIDEQIYLRTLEPMDDEALFLATDRSRSYLQQWLPWLKTVQSIADSRKFIDYTTQLLDERKSMVFGVFLDHQLVGTISYNQLDWPNGIGHIGYWLGLNATGKGVMTKSVQGLIDYGFDKLGLNRVEIRCATENIKSRSIPKRLGFSEEGFVRQVEWLYDHFVDHAIYGLLRQEWLANKS